MSRKQYKREYSKLVTVVTSERKTRLEGRSFGSSLLFEYFTPKECKAKTEEEREDEEKKEKMEEDECKEQKKICLCPTLGKKDLVS